MSIDIWIKMSKVLRKSNKLKKILPKNELANILYNLPFSQTNIDIGNVFILMYICIPFVEGDSYYFIIYYHGCKYNALENLKIAFEIPKLKSII